MLFILKENLSSNNWEDVNDYGVHVEDKHIPETPSIEISKIKIPGGRTIKQSKEYEERNIKVDCIIVQDNDAYVKRNLMDLMFKLSQEIVIRFKDKPDLIYFVDLTNSPSYKEILSDGGGEFKLDFTSFDGFRYSIDNAGEITLDSDIILNNDILLDEETGFSNITGTTSLQINNAGTYEVRPVIVLEGIADLINISTNGITTTYKNLKSGEIVYIDCNEYTVTKKVNNDITNTLPNWWGDFIYLRSGINDIQITGTNLNITRLKFYFRHTFL